MKFITVKIQNVKKVCVVLNNNIYDITNQYGDSLEALMLEETFSKEIFRDKIISLKNKFARLPLTYQELIEKKHEKIKLSIPFLPSEVWAVGVSYKKTMELHEHDMKILNKNMGLYSYVYSSKRPEIFFKALPQHCVGPQDSFGIRSDSEGTIVEAELACIFNKKGKIIAYTGANDVTAWDIEKECPLFLNQAKIFEGSLVLGPAAVPADNIDPLNIEISCKVIRGKKTLFEGYGNTSSMKRSLGEMKKYLMNNNILSSITVLCTGTAVGIPVGLSIKDGDIVEMNFDGIGKIINRARRLGA